MFFSYEKGSLADIYPLDAAEVAEIIKMNRNGMKPESLRSEPEPRVPEFITAVGDDSITRFDKPKRRKGGRGRRKRGGGGGGNAGNGGNGGDRKPKDEA